MKKILMLAAGALCVGFASGSAYAAEGGTVANTEFTEIPGVVAQAPVQHPPVVATAKLGQPTSVYMTNSRLGTWLFPPQDGGGANS